MKNNKIKKIANPILNATEQKDGFIGCKEALKDLKESRRILNLINNNIDLYIEELANKTKLNKSDIISRLNQDLPEIIRLNKRKEELAKKNLLINARLIKRNIKEVFENDKQH